MSEKNHSADEKVGVLLINLGTPENTTKRDIRRFLWRFLNDPRVISLKTWLRWLLLRLIIIPFRVGKVQEAYQSIWQKEGSPLLINGKALAKKLQDAVPAKYRIKLAMQHSKPAIPDAIKELVNEGVRKIKIFPLYPQYSSATWGALVESVYKEAGKLTNVPALEVAEPYYDHPAYIESLAQVSRPYISKDEHDYLLFSYHGLPESQVVEGGLPGQPCTLNKSCCENGSAKPYCYRAHCIRTTRLLADALNLKEDQYDIAFQSRLGRMPWLGPYTDQLLDQRVAEGKKRALVLSPSFTADCLETLEEIGIRAKEDWEKGGGSTLTLVPAVNSEDHWVDAIIKMNQLN